MRLGYAISVSGAAPDTLMLTKFDVLPIRFLLSVFSLRLGDFVRLAPDGKIAAQIGTTFRRLEERAAPAAAGNEVRAATAQFLAQRIWDGAPVALILMACHLLVMLGRGLDDVGGCGAYQVILQMGLSGFVILLVLSFFAFAPQLRWLMRSPLILQFQMMFMHRHQAIEPPPYVYVSDGGLIECLGVLMLLRRRMPLIICSDACEDMNVTLRALLDTIHLAREEKLCSFFDVDDPRRDVQLTMAEVKESHKPYLRLGIRYEPDASGAALEGELLYIRMRLAPGDQASERDLLSRSELLDGPPPPPGSSFAIGSGPRSPDDLRPRRCEMNGRSGSQGPIARWVRMPGVHVGMWCEGTCARRCPGRRFPDFGTGNQFLQPRHFANLCALGAEMALPAELVESLNDWAKVVEEPRLLRLLRSKAQTDPMTSILRRSMLAVSMLVPSDGNGALETCRLLRRKDQLRALDQVTFSQFQAAEQCLGAVVLDASAAAPVAQLQRLAEAMLRHLAARFRAPEAPKTKPRETPRTPPPSAVGPSPVLAPPEPMPLPRKRGGRSTGKDDDEFADAEEMPKTRDASETPSPPTYILSNRLSPRTSFDDAHFGVADYQMQQAALTKISPRPMPPNVVNQCTYTRMAAAGSFCCDAKDADYGLSDEQLEAKNRLTQAAAESQAAGGVVTEGFLVAERMGSEVYDEFGG
eukprot:g19354.t1